jgi:hypothetical protein
VTGVSERCRAAHGEDRSDCDGPPMAVRVVDQFGEQVTGCVHHGAVLLASLDSGRVYTGPDAVDGAAIEVYRRAQRLAPFDVLSAGTGGDRR